MEDFFPGAYGGVNRIIMSKKVITYQTILFFKKQISCTFIICTVATSIHGHFRSFLL